MSEETFEAWIIDQRTSIKGKNDRIISEFHNRYGMRKVVENIAPNTSCQKKSGKLAKAKSTIN